jgi:hypothetical protein
MFPFVMALYCFHDLLNEFHIIVAVGAIIAPPFPTPFAHQRVQFIGTKRLMRRLSGLLASPVRVYQGTYFGGLDTSLRFLQSTGTKTLMGASASDHLLPWKV